MKLREYMTTHGGEFHLAETPRPLAPEHLDAELAEEEVVVYVVGQKPDGRHTVHLYGRNHRRHIVTYMGEEEIETVNTTR